MILGASFYALRSLLRLIWKPTNVPAALAVFVVASAWLLAEDQNRRLHEEKLRTEVLSHVSLIRAKLEGSVRHNIELVRGLVARIATEPRMTQERFSELASTVLGGRTQIRNISVAPDLVVTMVHPIEGYQRVIGIDYRANPSTLR